METTLGNSVSKVSETIPNPDDQAVSKAINAVWDKDGFFILSRDEYVYMQVVPYVVPYHVDFQQPKDSYHLEFRDGKESENLATEIKSPEEVLRVVTDYLHGRDFKNGHEWEDMR